MAPCVFLVDLNGAKRLNPSMDSGQTFSNDLNLRLYLMEGS